eukprot:g18048.t1
MFRILQSFHRLELIRSWTLDDPGTLPIQLSRLRIQRNLISVTSARAARPLWRHTSETLRLLRRWQLRADVVCWSSVLKAAHGGTPSTWTRLCALLTDMSSGSIAGDVISFNAAMHRTPWQLSGAVLRMMNLQRVFPDVATFTHAMNACALKLSWHEALLFAGAAWTAQVQLDQMALTPLLAAHPWRKGLSLAQARAQPDVVTFSARMEACAQALQWELGFDSLVAMMNVGVEANAMTRTSLCIVWRGALEILEMLGEHDGLDMVMQDVLLSTLDLSGHLRSYGEALQAMADAAVEELGQKRVNRSPSKEVALWQLAGDLVRPLAEPDLLAATAVLGACVERWTQSLACLSRMSTLRLLLDQVPYNSAMKACAQNGFWPTALDLTRKLGCPSPSTEPLCLHAGQHAAGQRTALLHTNISSIMTTYNIAINACDDWRRISEWLASARRAQLGLRVDAISWNSALKAGASPWQRPLEILRQMQDEALLPDALTADAWANTWRPQQWQQALSAQFCRSPLPRLAAAAVQGSPWQLASSLATTSRQRRAEPVSVGDGGGAWPRALQLVGGGAWQQSLQLLYGAPMQRLRAEASGVKLLSSMEPKRQAFRCELYRSVGRWWAALHVWEEMEQHGLRADEVHCSSLLRACDEERVPNGWCRALALLRSLSSGVRRDPILWNALLATTSLPRGGSAAPADPRRSAWARPLVLVKAMWESAVVPDIVTFNTLLSASRWEGMLAILLQMEQMRTPIEDVAALTVVDSCAQAGQLALGRHILENIFQHVPAVLRLWSFAQLGVANASAIAAAFRHARDDERRTGLSAAEVPKVWWACGILGVNSSFSQRLAQISAGDVLSIFARAQICSEGDAPNGPTTVLDSALHLGHGRGSAPGPPGAAGSHGVDQACGVGGLWRHPTSAPELPPRAGRPCHRRRPACLRVPTPLGRAQLRADFVGQDLQSLL